MTREEFDRVCENIAYYQSRPIRCRMFIPSSNRYFEVTCSLRGIGTGRNRDNFIVGHMGHSCIVHYRNARIN